MEVYIGLMSGTSLDGCDAALVGFEGEQPKLLHFITLPMPGDLKQQVLAACSLEHSNIALICSLNVALGQFFAAAALALCQEAGFPLHQVRAIASHGQTVYHLPQQEGDLLASTLQLGEPAIIAQQTGRPVVSSFRAMDMALGGQGAPLVPLADFLIYRHLAPIALQNIGGIGNISLLPDKEDASQVFAFDTGPGNMIIDALCRHFYGLPYDEDGRLAAQGQVDQALLARWMALPFIDQAPPKSTGRELYGDAFVLQALLQNPGLGGLDFLATATAYTAHSIAHNLQRFVLPRAKGLNQLVLSGGGAHNMSIQRFLCQLLPDLNIFTQEDLGYDSDAKEALAFAILGRQRLKLRPGNLPSATGAKAQAILGSLTQPPQWGAGEAMEGC